MNLFKFLSKIFPYLSLAMAIYLSYASLSNYSNEKMLLQKSFETEENLRDLSLLLSERQKLLEEIIVFKSSERLDKEDLISTYRERFKRICSIHSKICSVTEETIDFLNFDSFEKSKKEDALLRFSRQNEYIETMIAKARKVSNKFYIMTLDKQLQTGQNLRSILLLLVSFSFLAIFNMIKQNIMYKEINHQRKFYSNILDELDEGQIHCNTKGDIVRYNRSALSILRLSSEQVDNMNVVNVLPKLISRDGKYLRDQSNPIRSFIEKRELQKENIYGFLTQELQQKWISLSMLELNTSAVDLDESIIITMSDVTQLINAYDLIKEQQRMNIQKSKMNALGEMAAGIAHEINNPLAVIQGNSNRIARIISKEPVDIDRIHSSTEKIMNTVKRITKITQGLRVFARDGSVDPYEPCLLSIIIKDVETLIEPFLQNKSIEFSFSTSLDINNYLVECRYIQLTQVLINFLSNSFYAVEAMDTPWVKLEVTSVDDAILFSVIDSGNGIPQEVQDKIFQPFFTTKPIGKGTGLGMAISKGIIEDHKGEIWIDNNSPNTKISFAIPTKHGTLISAKTMNTIKNS